jgi:hypothetical protein
MQNPKFENRDERNDQLHLHYEILHKNYDLRYTTHAKCEI